MPAGTKRLSHLAPVDRFVDRHNGPRQADVDAMLGEIGLDSLDELISLTVPQAIVTKTAPRLPEAMTERQVLEHLRKMAGKNEVWRSFIGLGYHDCVTPPAIQRNLLENPGWYTAYTAYQPEISQGRLEALLNFQTMIKDLTGFEVANASLLDEGTAAAEAMTLCLRILGRKAPGRKFVVSKSCHPQTIAVVSARALPLDIEVVVADHENLTGHAGAFGVLLQYPATDGRIHDYEEICRELHAAGALVVIAADPLALTMLRPPGEFGADVAVGSTQRFGVPLGFGGPHAAYLATGEAHQRQIPGRIVGLSKDAQGRPALRLALQTREQHIRRGKATSNICTAQVLLAVIAATYAVYHGPQGLLRIARRIHRLTQVLALLLGRLGHRVHDGPFFDTLRVTPLPEKSTKIADRLATRRINLRSYDDGDFGIAFGQTTSRRDIIDLFEAFGGSPGEIDREEIDRIASELAEDIPAPLRRTSTFLQNQVFHRYRSETELMRYLHRLAGRDLSLNTSMIPLGSCTMKLNAATEMSPITWPGFSSLHPFAPLEQCRGYEELFDDLERWLSELTGFHRTSLMPNAGAQGEYAGLQVIRAYHENRGDAGRNVCLIPRSAHGTNPASAVMAGMKVVVVGCDESGNIDLADLEAKAEQHSEHLAALMVTYPSTHGVFEEEIRDICRLVHRKGGQVYLDGANMNAMLGICRPGDFGADVCHLNLHKTFAIPHGGGGPGMGPIATAEHLSDFLPRHPFADVGGSQGIGPVSSAPWGSPGILPISYAFIALMGLAGLKRATMIAILNANYIAHRLGSAYEVLYKGKNGFVAHECILDVRPFKQSAGIEVDDFAKRLMDFGFHAPTMSWPVAGTLMVEPTESESREEIDRFCDAMLIIREEIRKIEDGRWSREDHPLRHAPHTSQALLTDSWNHAYSREEAAFPAEWVRDRKFWPAVGRVDNVWGDRHLICSCPDVDSYS